jgi:hypothetical protein
VDHGLYSPGRRPPKLVKDWSRRATERATTRSCLERGRVNFLFSHFIHVCCSVYPPTGIWIGWEIPTAEQRLRCIVFSSVICFLSHRADRHAFCLRFYSPQTSVEYEWKSMGSLAGGEQMDDLYRDCDSRLWGNPRASVKYHLTATDRTGGIPGGRSARASRLGRPECPSSCASPVFPTFFLPGAWRITPACLG